MRTPLAALHRPLQGIAPPVTLFWAGETPVADHDPAIDSKIYCESPLKIFHISSMEPTVGSSPQAPMCARLQVRKEAEVARIAAQKALARAARALRRPAELILHRTSIK